MRRLTQRQRVAAFTLAILALCFITLDLGGSSLASAHDGVRGTFGSLYRGTDAVLGPVRRFVQGIPSAGSNEAKLSELRAQNAMLRGDLASAKANAQSQAELSMLHLDSSINDFTILPVRVIALGASAGFSWTVTVDSGTASGVRVGQSVTDGNALVGRVLHADSATSVVLLAADPGSGVGARDLRNGEVGLVSGNGADGFTFAALNPTAELKVGDQLATGPTGQTSFVAGLAIGQISSVRTGSDGTTRAAATPAASPTSLDLLGVILGTSRSAAPRAAVTPVQLPAAESSVVTSTSAAAGSKPPVRRAR